ncbi:MAG: S9 family peptidase [Blastomonas sp.]
MKKTALALFAASMLASATAHARPMTEVDLATMDRVGAPMVSPDGKWIAYTVTTTDLDANRRTSALWLLDVTAKDAKPVAMAGDDGGSRSDPAFSPDGGWLYFLGSDSGTSQVWRMPVAGGDAEQVTQAAVDLSGYRLSPDGAHLAVWADIDRGCALESCAGKADGEKPMGSGREYDHMFVRHWDAWETPGNYSTLFVYDLDGEARVSGVARNVSGAIIGDAPTKPFGGGEEIAWLPDSSAIAFTIRKADGQEPLSTNTDIVLAPMDANLPTVNLTAANEATDTLPAPSPDGKWLAWAAMERSGYESDRLGVRLLELSTGKLVDLAKDWDRSVGSIAWTPDSAALIVTAQDVLDHPAFRIDLSGKVTRLTGAGNVHDVTPLAKGAMIYALNSVTRPDEIFWQDRKGRTRMLTDANGARFAELDPVSAERFSFEGADGDTVWGQIVKPAGVEGMLPLAFLVHGGPQGSFGNSWSSRWNPMVMASQGLATVSVDFHGSTGYGQAFTDSINRDWGGKPLEDLKLGLAAIPGIDPQIDTANGCALGASYGGYMMNWIAGQWPDAFKCIVNHDGVFDLRGMAFATEELWFDEWDQGGPWWQREDAEKWNPVNHVDKWKTPMLVIHGEKDFRIPLAQSLGAFTALQRQDIPSKLLVFPDENHWVLKARNSVQWHRNVFAWLDRWLDKPEPQETAAE